MAAPFVAEIRPWACNFAPIGWAMCQGQILPISQYTALFSLIGTYYGGNGTSNFQLPDLQGRVPMKFGTDPTGNNYVIGEEAGTSQHGNFYYGPSNGTTTTINVGTVAAYTGGNQAHTNLQPFLAINWCIALQGIYPSRN